MHARSREPQLWPQRRLRHDRRRREHGARAGPHRAFPRRVRLSHTDFRQDRLGRGRPLPDHDGGQLVHLRSVSLLYPRAGWLAHLGRLWWQPHRPTWEGNCARQGLAGPERDHGLDQVRRGEVKYAVVCVSGNEHRTPGLQHQRVLSGQDQPVGDRDPRVAGDRSGGRRAPVRHAGVDEEGLRPAQGAGAHGVGYGAQHARAQACNPRGVLRHDRGVRRHGGRVYPSAGGRWMEPGRRHGDGVQLRPRASTAACTPLPPTFPNLPHCQ